MNNGSRSFSWPWFILGCFLLLVAVVAFFWGFALGELTPARRFLLMWILPLASAFACGCFSGAMSASGPLGTLTIAATGGFAVWLLSYFLLPNPEPSKAPDSLSFAFDKGTSFRQAAEQIAQREGFSISFKCNENFLTSEVSSGTMTAKGAAELLEKLGSHLIANSPRSSYRVIRIPDKGLYEIRCE